MTKRPSSLYRREHGAPSTAHDPRFDPHRHEEAARAKAEARTARGGGFGLGRLFGVEIRVDWSLLIIFALITWNLGALLFPLWHPDWPALLSWGVALGAAVLFFASVLAHELSHAVVARSQGISVRRVTLFLFGGLAHMEGEPPSPKAELLMTIVGPLTSLLIGVGATLLGSWLAGPVITAADVDRPMEVMREVGPGATLLLWLGPINVLLAIFNMLPGFPLDGGRVLRSILWWSTGDFTKATRWAAGAGRGFAWLLMGFGVLNIFGGAFAQGLWLLLIGWFLNNAAVMSYQRVLMSQALENVRVERLMRTHVDTVPPRLTVDELVREHLITSDQHGFPVQDDGQLLGLVSLQDVRKLPQNEWPRTYVEQVMTPADELATLPSDADAELALNELAKRDVDQIPVVDDGHLRGLVRRGDIVRWLALHGVDAPRT